MSRKQNPRDAPTVIAPPPRATAAAGAPQVSRADLEALRATAALHSMIAQGARDLVCFLHPDGIRVLNSPSYALLLGDPDKLFGSQFYDDVCDEDRERVRAAIARMARTKGSARIEYRLRTHEGALRNIECNARAIRGAAGGTTGIVLLEHDVTEQRADAARLQAAQARQDAVVEFSLFALRQSAPQAVFERAAALVAQVLGADLGTVLELEPKGRWLRIVAEHGAPTDSVGKRVSTGNDTQSGRAIDAFRRGKADEEKPPVIAIENMKADRDLRRSMRVRDWGMVSSACVVIPAAARPFGTLAVSSRARRRFAPEEAAFLQAVANVLSATLERFQAQAALRASEARFRSLADLSADWYWELDAELRFCYLSERFFDKSGVSRDEILGRRRWEIPGAMPISGDWDAHRHTLQARRPFRDFECCHTQPDGARSYQTVSGEPVFDDAGNFQGYRGTGRDVSERRRAEEELRARTRADAMLIEFGLVAAREEDAGRLLNDAVRCVAHALEVELVKVLELLPDGSGLTLVAGVGWKPGAVGKAVVGRDLDSQAGFTLFEYENAQREKGETFRPEIVEDLRTETRFSGSALLHEHGVVSGVSVVIPGPQGAWGVLGAHARSPRHFGRREAEFLQAAANLIASALRRCEAARELRDSEARYRDLVETTHDLIWAVDAEGRITFMNQASRRIYGREPEEMIGRLWLDFVPPEMREGQVAKFREMLGTGADVFNYEATVYHKNGSLVVLSADARVVRDRDGQPAGTAGCSHDITELKRAEAVLRESEARFRSLTELSSDWYWEQDAELRFVFRSTEGTQRAGLLPSKVRGLRRWELPNVEALSCTWDEHRAVLEARLPFRDFEYAHTDAAGQRHFLSVSGEPVYDADGRFKGYRGVSRNVTERRFAELALAASEERFRSLWEACPDSVIVIDERSVICFANRAVKGAFGYAPEDLVGKPLSALQLARAQGPHRDLLARYLQTGVKTVDWRGVRTAGRRADGSEFPAEVSFSEFTAGGRRFFAGIVRDVSERVRREEELRLFRAGMDASGDLISLIDPKAMRYVDVNETICRTLGYTREELLAMGPQDVLPESREALQQTYEQLIADPAAIQGMTSVYRCKDGSRIPFEASRRVLQTKGGALIVAIARDIRQRLQAEQALRESEARFRSLTGLSSDWYWEMDTELRFTVASYSAEGKAGLAPGELIGRRRWELAGVKPLSSAWDEHRALLATRKPFRDFEYVRVDAEGRPHYVAVSGEPFYGGDGAFLGYRGVGRDITERKLAEGEMARSEQRHRVMFDASPVPIYVYDRETLRILAVNERMVRQYGWTRAELEGMSMLALRPPDERARALATARGAVDSGERRQWLHWRRSGERFEVEVTAHDIEFDGRAARLASPVDVSERARSERMLRELADTLRSVSRRLVRAQEEERRVLARELHDRVGQNLTALAVNLEILRSGSGRLAPPELERRMRESVELVEATARLVDNVTVELRPPMLDQFGLVGALRWFAQQQATRTGLRIELRLPPGDGPATRPERDLALFRILQEAFNNVVKHARATRIEISLREAAQGLTLEVRDDGCGIGTGGDARIHGRLGLRSMRERALAVGARLELEAAAGGGTIVRVIAAP